MIATTSILPGAKGVDYSFGRPDPAEMARLGYRFAVRYISTRIDHPKNITADEIKRLHAAGIAVLFVWETTVTRPFDGYAAGAADGKASRAWCERLGCPTSVPVLAAVDTDVTTKTLQAVLAYLDGFAEGLGPWPLGIYADTDVIEAMAGRSVLNWKPNARAWSTKPSNLVHVQQHASTTVAGGLVDTNTALRPFTAWLPNDAPPEPIAPQEDDDMPTIIVTSPGRGDATLTLGGGVTFVGLASPADRAAVAAALKIDPNPTPISGAQWDAYVQQALWNQPQPPQPVEVKVDIPPAPTPKLVISGTVEAQP